MPANKKMPVTGGNHYDQDVMELGRNIRNARENVGLSLDELARLINSDKSHLSKIENGGQTPKIDSVFRIMDALEVVPSDIMPARFRPNPESGEWERIRSLYMRLEDGDKEQVLRYIRALLLGLLSSKPGKR